MRLLCSPPGRLRRPKQLDSLLRRVSGLIYVPDPERGMARQRVLKRLGLDQAI